MGAEPHTLTLHQTSAGNFIPVCSCSWIGYVAPTQRDRKGKSKRLVSYPDIARDQATAEHAAHVSAQRAPLIDRMNP